MRHIDDAERRARIAQRHGIAPGRRLPDILAATEAMTVLHATEHATVYLSLAARVDGLRVTDVDAALYEDRSLVKQLAMRRTLFAFPRALLGPALGSASARVAEQERRRLAKAVVLSGISEDGDAWLDAACAAILERLASGDAIGMRELRASVPMVAGTVTSSPGSRWGGEAPIAPRLVTYLGALGLVARGRNAGHWRIARPTWTLMSRWLDEPPAPATAGDGYAELVRRWLRTFGPGTEEDVRWWLGGTLGAVRGALAQVEAVQVSLDGGGTGWVLPDDVESVVGGEPWAALLPVLDATTMGWKERGFYLGSYAPQLFDSVGNGGTTAWWNGRIVGCWIQDPDASVRVVLLEEVSADARRALQVEADRLTAWLDGVQIATVYSAAAMRAARSEG